MRMTGEERTIAAATATTITTTTHHHILLHSICVISGQIVFSVRLTNFENHYVTGTFNRRNYEDYDELFVQNN
jgi:hypothetical protein